MICETTFEYEGIVYQIAEIGNSFWLQATLVSVYEEEPTCSFKFLGTFEKDLGYDRIEYVRAVVEDKDFAIYALKKMLEDYLIKRDSVIEAEDKIEKISREEKSVSNDMVGLSERPLLTVQEMALLSGIGEKKLYWIIENYASYENNFVVKIGNKNLFKREKFFEFVNKTDAL